MSLWKTAGSPSSNIPESASCCRLQRSSNRVKILLKITLLILALSSLAMAQEGTRVYIANCQQCHDQNSDSHAPLKEALANRPWEQIVKALETGAMRAQGAQLSPEERRAVARYLGKA